MTLHAAASLIALLLLGATAGCDRNDIEAINLAQEGDQARKGDPDGAISKYEQATRLDPKNTVILQKLADQYEKKEQWDKVASTMALATKLAPKNATFWYKRGKALARQAEKGPTPWDEAKDPLAKCIDADTNYDDCYFTLGEVMLQTDDEQRALENWTKAVQHNPNELIFYAPLADLYINLGYYQQAGDVLKEAQSFAKNDKQPGVVNIYQLQARLAQAKGDLPGAAAALEKARTADAEGQHPEILFNLGSTYAVMTPPKKGEALQMLKAFQKVGCQGPRAKKYKPQCDQAQTLVMNVGGGS